MTGTPLDLTPFGPLLGTLGLLYWAAALCAAALALGMLRSQSWWLKALIAGAVLAAFIYPVATHIQEKHQRYDETKAKLDAAMAPFQERCKTADEKISRTVENVDGIVWMKWRPEGVNLSDQFKFDDPYGKDCSGDECIKRLLRVTKGAELNPEDAKEHARGYRFVETIDPSDGQRYRYIGVIKSVATRTADEIEQYKKNSGGRDPGPDVYGFTLQRAAITSLSARYGITWDDLSTREDREHWIAGSSLQAIDLQTNEVIAERVGYMLDRGLGQQPEYRSVWSQAQRTACPTITSETTTYTFATKVIQPSKRGEQT